MRPSMLVQEGESVKKGQALLKTKEPRCDFTSPACGVVKAINRGERRVLQSVVIEIQGDEQLTFDSYDRRDLPSLTREQAEKNPWPPDYGPRCGHVRSVIPQN